MTASVQQFSEQRARLYERDAKMEKQVHIDCESNGVYRGLKFDHIDNRRWESSRQQAHELDSVFHVDGVGIGSRYSKQGVLVAIRSRRIEQWDQYHDVTQTTRNADGSPPEIEACRAHILIVCIWGDPHVTGAFTVNFPELQKRKPYTTRENRDKGQSFGAWRFADLDAEGLILEKWGNV